MASGLHLLSKKALGPDAKFQDVTCKNENVYQHQKTKKTFCDVWMLTYHVCVVVPAVVLLFSNKSCVLVWMLLTKKKPTLGELCHWCHNHARISSFFNHKNPHVTETGTPVFGVILLISTDPAMRPFTCVPLLVLLSLLSLSTGKKAEKGFRICAFNVEKFDKEKAANSITLHFLTRVSLTLSVQLLFMVKNLNVKLSVVLLRILWCLKLQVIQFSFIFR